MSLDEIIPGNDIDKLLIDCYYCNEHKTVHIYYNQENNWSMYQCTNNDCKKTYLMDWDKKDNWYEEQKR